MQVNLGLVPVQDDDETSAALEVVDGALSDALGAEIDLHIAETPEALATAFGDGVINAAWASPTLVCGHEAFRVANAILTSVREGSPFYHGVLFVLRDGPCKSLLDLRGTRVAWVAKSSASGYIYPRVALSDIGIDVTDFFSDERFLGTHGAVVHAVVRGEVEVGATFAVFHGGDATRPVERAAFVDLGLRERIRVLLPTPPIPADVFVASGELTDSLGDALPRAVLDAAKRFPDAFNVIFGTSVFARTSQRGLDPLRASMDMARELGVID